MIDRTDFNHPERCVHAAWERLDYVQMIAERSGGHDATLAMVEELTTAASRIARAQASYVNDLRDAGYSWATIGDALRMTARDAKRWAFAQEWDLPRS